MTVPTITLNDGTTIPQLGFGVFQVPPAETAETVTAGPRGRLPPHRHRADVRQRGGRRRGDRAPPASPRDELYVTTKLNNGFHRPDDARRAFEAVADRRSASTSVDLFLIHWPLPTQYDGDFVSTWKTLAELADGRPRHARIGVSNFQPAHLDRIIDETGVRPGGQPDRGAPVLRATRPPAPPAPSTASLTEAWSPIAQGKVHRRRRDRRDRRRPRQVAGRRWRCAGTSSAATSSSRSRCTPSGCRRTSRSSTSRSPPTTGRADQRPRPGRGRPDRARTRTSSTTSRTDPLADSCRLVPNGKNPARMSFVTNRRTRRLHVKRPSPGLEQVRQPRALEVGEPGQQPALVGEVASGPARRSAAIPAAVSAIRAGRGRRRADACG